MVPMCCTSVICFGAVAMQMKIFIRESSYSWWRSLLCVISLIYNVLNSLWGWMLRQLCGFACNLYVRVQDMP